MLASPDYARARRGRAPPRLVGGGGAAGRDRRALQAPFRPRHRRRHRLDRDAAHLHLQPAGSRCATARPAGRCRATKSNCAARMAALFPTASPGDLYIHGPSAAMMYWGNRAKTRETFQGDWTKSGDKYIRNSDGSLTYAGRSDDMLKVERRLCEPVRGRGDHRPASGGARGRRHRRARRGRAHQDQGLRRARSRRARGRSRA